MMAPSAVQPIAPADASPVFSDAFWKRFQTDETLAQHLPLFTLDAEGSIESITRAARSLLEYSPSQSLDPYFFTHIHGRNLRRVMQDLALMVCKRKQSARWLLRLRTGTGRWRWYRATALSRLHDAEGRVFVRLERI